MGIGEKLRRVTRAAPGPKAHVSPSRPDRGDPYREATAVAAYTYLLRIASSGLLEQLHAEAFALLSEDQRQRLFLRLRHDFPDTEVPVSTEPEHLATAAVAAEALDRGYLLRALRRPGQGVTEGHAVANSARASGASLFAGLTPARARSTLVQAMRFGPAFRSPSAATPVAPQ